MKKHLIPFILLLVLCLSCSIGPKSIDYGHVGCHFCSMTIVDQQHAAQLVTQKGKVFNFDAIECMLNQLKKEDQSEIALFLVNDYEQPGELVDATKATYLISENIPSPMGNTSVLLPMSRQLSTSKTNKVVHCILGQKSKTDLNRKPKNHDRFETLTM